jgi:hypothetical protein
MKRPNLDAALRRAIEHGRDVRESAELRPVCREHGDDGDGDVVVALLVELRGVVVVMATARRGNDAERG